MLGAMLNIYKVKESYKIKSFIFRCKSKYYNFGFENNGFLLLIGDLSTIDSVEYFEEL